MNSALSSHLTLEGSHITRRIWLPFVATLTLLAGSATAIAQQTTYRLTHLGTGTFSTGFNFADINNRNEVVGFRFIDLRQAGGFIWRDGELHDLDPVPDNTQSAFAINDRTEVVGLYEDAQSQLRSFLWRRGKITRIETIPGQVVEIAIDINNRREVLISSLGPQGVSSFFVWRNGELTRLEPLPGFEGTESPVRLNDRGMVVGSAWGPAGPIPVLWEHGTVMQIQLPSGATAGNVDAINNRGAVVGTAEFPGRVAGYLWRDGQASELRPPSGFVSTIASDINNRHAIVGTSYITGDEPFVATLWPCRGDPVDLNTVIADDDPLKPFVHLVSAYLINDRGVIVANGTDSRNEPFSNSTYLLTPLR